MSQIITWEIELVVVDAIGTQPVHVALRGIDTAVGNTAVATGGVVVGVVVVVVVAVSCGSVAYGRHTGAIHERVEHIGGGGDDRGSSSSSSCGSLSGRGRGRARGRGSGRRGERRRRRRRVYAVANLLLLVSLVADGLVTHNARCRGSCAAAAATGHECCVAAAAARCRLDHDVVLAVVVRRRRRGGGGDKRRHLHTQTAHVAQALDMFECAATTTIIRHRVLVTHGGGDWRLACCHCVMSGQMQTGRDAAEVVVAVAVAAAVDVVERGEDLAILDAHLIAVRVLLLLLLLLMMMQMLIVLLLLIVLNVVVRRAVH